MLNSTRTVFGLHSAGYIFPMYMGLKAMSPGFGALVQPIASDDGFVFLMRDTGVITACCAATLDMFGITAATISADSLTITRWFPDFTDRIDDSTAQFMNTTKVRELRCWCCIRGRGCFLLGAWSECMHRVCVCAHQNTDGSGVEVSVMFQEVSLGTAGDSFYLLKWRLGVDGFGDAVDVGAGRYQPRARGGSTTLKSVPSAVMRPPQQLLPHKSSAVMLKDSGHGAADALPMQVMCPMAPRPVAAAAVATAAPVDIIEAAVALSDDGSSTGGTRAVCRLSIVVCRRPRFSCRTPTPPLCLIAVACSRSQTPPCHRRGLLAAVTPTETASSSTLLPTSRGSFLVGAACAHRCRTGGGGHRASRRCRRRYCTAQRRIAIATRTRSRSSIKIAAAALRRLGVARLATATTSPRTTSVRRRACWRRV
jgi:hypothetical protein